MVCFISPFLVKISLCSPINVSRQSNDETGQWFVSPFEKLWLRWSLRTNCYVYGLYFFTWWYLGMCSDMYVFIDMLVLKTLSYCRKLGRTLVVMPDCVGWNIRIINHAFWRMLLIG